MTYGGYGVGHFSHPDIRDDGAFNHGSCVEGPTPSNPSVLWRWRKVLDKTFRETWSPPVILLSPPPVQTLHFLVVTRQGRGGVVVLFQPTLCVYPVSWHGEKLTDLSSRGHLSRHEGKKSSSRQSDTLDLKYVISTEDSRNTGQSEVYKLENRPMIFR